MSKTPPTTGQTIYRLSVMVGTLSVGSMAAYLYGPSPEKLASLINTTTNAVVEMAEHRSSAFGANEASQLAETSPKFPPNTPLFEANSTSSAGLSNTQPYAVKEFATNDIAGYDGAELLRRAGATSSTITPWGGVDSATGQTLFRAAATMPVGSSDLLVEQLDAIGDSPEKAVEALLAQMNRIRR